MISFIFRAKIDISFAKSPMTVLMKNFALDSAVPAGFCSCISLAILRAKKDPLSLLFLLSLSLSLSYVSLVSFRFLGCHLEKIIIITEMKQSCFKVKNYATAKFEAKRQN